MTIRHCICVGAALAASLLAATASAATRAAGAACSPAATILESPRPNTLEAQAKAINDRGDIVGFADSKRGSGAIHAILWKGGKAAGAVDLGVLPGYVASEAYGINDHRVVLRPALRQEGTCRPVPVGERSHDGAEGPERAPPLHREPGRGRPERDQRPRRDGVDDDRRRRPTGRPLDARRQGDLPSRAAGSHLDERVRHQRRRRRVRLVAPLPNGDGAENPVLWTRTGKVVPLRTAPGRADGIAEATNRAGLTVGYLGNLTDADPESDQFAVWRTRTAEPQLLGPVRAEPDRRVRRRERPRPGGRA